MGVNSSDVRVFWIFGLSGAGKSTLADGLTTHLRNSGRTTLHLDGDRMRAGLCSDLGFSERDRSENIRRAVEVARLASDSGMNVVASFITPMEMHRRIVGRAIGPRLSLIYADAPVDVCAARDTKGLYAKAKQGLIPPMTGAGATFEPPGATDLHLYTPIENVEDSLGQLFQFADQIFSRT